ncbi:MAG TPA: dihydroneopterin triphosphate diphosphatase [Gammaproteobacteria bacterium]|nr:dihydroneopterin triphosphate diphosphatase [Gammaproteobacteria bacterium]
MPDARGFKRPESVLVVIHTRALECLLLERVQPKGFWQSVTGSLRWDETPAEAAAREVREETGLDPAGLRDAHVQSSFPILPEWRARYGEGVDTNVEHLWYLELPAPRDVVLAPREHVRYGWLPLEEAIRKVSSWTNREALERLRAAAAKQ